jgi:hypothetical protein
MEKIIKGIIKILDLLLFLRSLSQKLEVLLDNGKRQDKITFKKTRLSLQKKIKRKKKKIFLNLRMKLFLKKKKVKEYLFYLRIF